MAYDERLAERIFDLIGARPDVRQQKMFGGIAYMLNGHMCCGVLGDELVVRTGPAATPALLKEPHTHPMEFTGKPMASMVQVTAEGVKTAASLKKWVQRGVAFAETLPPKVDAPKRSRAVKK